MTGDETRQRGLGSQAGSADPAHRKTRAPECGLEAVHYLLSEEWSSDERPIPEERKCTFL